MKMAIDQQRQEFSRRLRQAAAASEKEYYGMYSDLARHFGLSTAAVKKWFDSNAIPLKRIDELAKYYGVRPEWLRLGKGPMREVEGVGPNGESLTIQIHKVPVISADQYEHYIANPEQHKESAGESRLAVGPLPEDAFAVKIQDNSLADKVLKGMCVVVDPHKEPGPDDLVLVYMNGAFVGGQLVKRDTYTIIPPNSDFRPIDLGQNPAIAGVMVQIAQQSLSG